MESLLISVLTSALGRYLGEVMLSSPSLAIGIITVFGVYVFHSLQKRPPDDDDDHKNRKGRITNLTP